MNVQIYDNCHKALFSNMSASKNCNNLDMPSVSFMDDGNQYVLDCLSDAQSMEIIAAEWKVLEKNCGEPYIYFQSFDWCYQWCKTFGQKSSKDDQQIQAINIYVLRRNGDLVMVWPTMSNKLDILGIRIQTFLTEPHGQYGNIICNRKQFPLAIAKRVWQHIKKTSAVDAIIFDQYPQSSFLRQIIADKGFVESSQKHSSILNLDAFDTWEDYVATLDRKQRKQRNQKRRKLAKTGEIKFETHYGGSERYRELIDLALDWKKVWLNKTGRRDAVLSQNRIRTFLGTLNGTDGAGILPPEGAVLGVLMVDEKPVGIEIGMCLDGHYYCYLGAFDWQQKSFSPGKIQIEEMQKWAKEAGLSKYDFLGDPADYKNEWINTTDCLESRSVALTIRGFFYCKFWKAYLRPIARVIFNNLSSGNRAKILGMMGITRKSDNLQIKSEHKPI